MKQDEGDPKSAAASPQVDDSGEKGTDTPEKKAFFDAVADFFQLMTKGIFVFAFYKLPCKIIKWIINLNYIAILKFLFSMWRAVLWISIWISVVFAAWILLALEKFVQFWTFVGQQIWRFIKFIAEHFFHILREYGPEIWFGIAVIGSIYGLLYLTLKRRAQKKNVPFHGVFGFLRKKKKEENPPQQSNNEGNSDNKPISQ